MTGLCGTVGTDSRRIDVLAEDLRWSEDERHFSYAEDGVCVHCSLLSDTEQHPPVSVDDADVWLWGNVYGFHGPHGYTSLTTESKSTEEWFAQLYDKHGPDFAAGINGDFFGLVHDHDRKRILFITDRIGSRDVYYTQTDDGTLVFSSRIQSLPKHPAIAPSFERDYLLEYLVYWRAFGTRTPLTDVSMFPPASVTVYDIDTQELRSEQYWQPIHRPVDKPFSYFVEEFANRFQMAVAERVPTHRDGALLLSGGSDSRLLLAALPDVDITAYHMADWMSREARIAERVALTEDIEFELLRRDQEYLETLLGSTPQMNNFVQRFHQAHVEGFIDQLRAEHDYILTNQLADVFFKGQPLPTRRLSVGSLGTIHFPLSKPIHSLADFLDWTATNETVPPYLNPRPKIRTILANNTCRERGGFRFHGVSYNSLHELILYNRVWPGTNGTDTFFRRSLHENITHHLPLLDTRLLDLWLTIPPKYFIRYDIINAALTRLAPDLAEIPHASTGVPLTWSFPFDFVGEYASKGLRKGLSLNETPVPTVSHGPWSHVPGLIRHRDFVGELITEKEYVLRRLPMLDLDGALKCYHDHLAGENNAGELLALSTFLAMPVTDMIVSKLN